MRNKILSFVNRFAVVFCFVFCLVLFFAVAPGSAHATDRYWYPDATSGTGTGKWSATGATGHWADNSSGLNVGGAVPTSSDNVYFTSTSFNGASQTVTVDAAAYSKDMDWTGATNSPTLSISGDSGLSAYGNVTFIAAMTISVPSGTSYLVSNGGNYTFNGVTVGVNFNLATGTTTFIDACNLGSKPIYQYGSSSLNTNGQTVTCGSFTIGGSSSKTLTLGNSTINCTSWNYTGSNLTLNAGTSTIKITGTGAFQGGGLTTYNNVELNGTAHAVSGSNTFASLKRTGTATKTDTVTFTSGTTQTITGVLNLSGNSSTNRLLVQSSTLGSPATITATNWTGSQNVDLMDITATNAVDLSAITGLSGDAQGNSGITFTAAAPQTFANGGVNNNYSTVGNWSSGRIPLPQDDVAIGTGDTVAMDMPRIGKNITFTGTPTVIHSLSISLYGSLTLASGMTFTNVSYTDYMRGRGSHTITSSGKAFRAFYVAAPGGTYTLADDMIVSGTSTVSYVDSGTFNDAGHAISFAGTLAGSSFSISGRTGPVTIIKSGTWTFSGVTTSTKWNATDPAGVTLIDTGTIIINGNGWLQTFAGGGLTYNNVTVQGNTYVLTVTGSNTFNTFTLNRSAGNRLVYFAAGTTQEFSNFIAAVSGTRGVTLASDDSENGVATLVKSGNGIVDLDYLTVSSITASPDNTWFAGANSTDGGGNSGWLFWAPGYSANTPSSLGPAGYIDGSAASDTTPTLTFSQSDNEPNATMKYTIQMSSNSDYSSPVVNYTSSLISQGATSYTPSSLPEGSYYWRVMSTDSGNDTSDWSNASSGVAFRIDTTAPGISLTALSDPNSDNTPTLLGIATESVETVSGVQFQMDSTAGSWSSCSAVDGSFSSGSEVFSCTVASALSDGEHTMYIGATDSNNNTTSGSYVSDTFTIDGTAPLSFDLESPGHESYTNSERPTFRWKAASTGDVTSGLSRYKLEVDNPSAGSGQVSGDFIVDNIPTSGTADVTSNRHVFRFENFADSDSTNNYISVYTRSSSDWPSSENDGKLREGKITWKIKAVDNAGNETSASRILYADFTNPSLTSVSADNIGTKDGYVVSTTTKPKITGTISDNLMPGKIMISFYKQNFFLGMETSRSLILSETNTLTNTNSATSLAFSLPPSQDIGYGKYRVIVKGIDKADNNSSEEAFNLQIMTETQAKTLLAFLSEEQKKKIGEQSSVSLPELEKKAILRRQKEASELAKLIRGLSGQVNTIATVIGRSISGTLAFIGNSSSSIFIAAGQGIHSVMVSTSGTTTSAIAYVLNITTNINGAFSEQAESVRTSRLGSLYRDSPVGEINRYMIVSFANSQKEMENKISETSQKTVQNFNSQLAIFNKFSKNQISNVENIIADANNALTDSQKEIGKQIAKTHQGTTKRLVAAGQAISLAWHAVYDPAQKITGPFSRLSYGLKIGISNFQAYVLDDNPTMIDGVAIEELGKDYVVISWKTNHYTNNNKVNYGADLGYGEEAWGGNWIKNHLVRITNLKPNQKYYFEVMSQNKNYVYDAYYSFVTKR